MRPVTEFTIFTPVYNSGELILSTINSLLANRKTLSPQIKLNYIIWDGGSTDQTVSIIQQAAETYTTPNLKISTHSEPDQGMYDALAKGFHRYTTGDIFGYINAGDYYSPYALEIVRRSMELGENWVTGRKVQYDESGAMISSSLPFLYRARLIRSGFYGTFLRYIQQESTFWHKSLHAKIDLKQLSQLKLAGDYYLWRTFAETADLTIINSWLGGFRIHENQQSENKESYLAELKSICSKPHLGDYFIAMADRTADFAPEEIRIKLMGDKLKQVHQFIDDRLY